MGCESGIIAGVKVKIKLALVADNKRLEVYDPDGEVDAEDYRLVVDEIILFAKSTTLTASVWESAYRKLVTEKIPMMLFCHGFHVREYNIRKKAFGLHNTRYMYYYMCFICSPELWQL